MVVAFGLLGVTVRNRSARATGNKRKRSSAGRSTISSGDWIFKAGHVWEGKYAPPRPHLHFLVQLLQLVNAQHTPHAVENTTRDTATCKRKTQTACGSNHLESNTTTMRFAWSAANEAHSRFGDVLHYGSQEPDWQDQLRRLKAGLRRTDVQNHIFVLHEEVLYRVLSHRQSVQSSGAILRVEKYVNAKRQPRFTPNSERRDGEEDVKLKEFEKDWLGLRAAEVEPLVNEMSAGFSGSEESMDLNGIDHSGVEVRERDIFMRDGLLHVVELVGGGIATVCCTDTGIRDNVGVGTIKPFIQKAQDPQFLGQHFPKHHAAAICTQGFYRPEAGVWSSGMPTLKQDHYRKYSKELKTHAKAAMVQASEATGDRLPFSLYFALPYPK